MEMFAHAWTALTTTPGRYFDSLRNAGVALLEYNPINPLRHPLRWSLHQRDHRKLLVVDGTVAFIGGVNISSVYSSPPSADQRESVVRWRDTHLRVEGPVVGELQRLYLDHWRSRLDRRNRQTFRHWTWRATTRSP
jgi:cardiolipin synthase